MDSIAEKVKYIRTSRKMNQTDFSQAISISQGRLSEIEQGKCKPSAETLIAISKCFKVDLNWLLLEDNNNVAPLSDYEKQLISITKEMTKNDILDVIDYAQFKLSKRK